MPPRPSARLLDEPVDIFLYVRHIVTRWRYVAVGVAVGVALAAAYTMVARPLYRSTLKLMVVPARLDQLATASARLDPLLAYNFLPFVRNADALNRAIEAAGLTRPEERWKMENFGQHFSPIVSKDAPIIELTLDFPDGEAGSRLVSHIADEAIKLNREMLTKSDTETRQFLKLQLDASTTQLRATEEAMQQFLRASRIEERRKEADAHLENAAKLLGLLQEKRLRNAELTSASETIARLLSEQHKLLELRRALSDDNAARSLSPDKATTSIVSEEINPLYARMEPRLVEQQSKAAAAGVAASRIAGELRESQQKAQALLAELNRDQITNDKLKLELELGRASYKNLSERYEQARISVAASSADLRVFEQPRQGGKVSPRPIPNLMFGAVLGGFLGVVLALGVALSQMGAATPRAVVRSEDRIASL
jgi:uncharacterized protein involved in exopolysaccharide biosynthesis